MPYQPVASDLQVEAQNKLEAIDAAIRHDRYIEAEDLTKSLAKTLQALQNLNHLGD